MTTRHTPNPAAVALGRLGGLAGKGKTSPAKAAAAQANGRLGGRPPKSQQPLPKSQQPLPKSRDALVAGAWVPCAFCEGWWCREHHLHAADCPCPEIDTWTAGGVDPYG